MKHKKILSLLLVFALLAGMLPGMTLSAFAAAGCVITVSADAPEEAETTQGEQFKLKLSDVFVDSEGHEMTYKLDGNYGTQTKIAANENDGGAMYLFFTSPDEGMVDVQITATCVEDPTVSAVYIITVDVQKGESGDAGQYGYDETPADSVKVYVTVSSDGVPMVGNDGTVLSHLEVEVPYFDLGKQGLSDFYRYHTENGEGSYVDDEIVMRPTALHLYLYMIGVYYLGLAPEEVTEGTIQIPGHEGKMGVQDLLGDTPYEDTMLALNITGSATSLYMQQFWGHDENLMYYRNHVYPLMSAGWGSTADYILLSDGDTIDVAMFSNWSFWQYGAFAAFDHDDYALTTDGSVQFKTVKYDTQSVADGGTEEFEPITGMDVAVYSDEWVKIDEIQPDEAEGSEYTLNAAELGLKAGTYYLLAMDPNASTDDACYAPATAKVVVKAAQTACEHETTETVYAVHSPADSKFDEIVKCTACGEQIGEAVEHLYGDVNGDGIVNVQDVIYLRNALKNNTELTAYQRFAADVNADGAVNTADTLVLSATMRNNTPFKGTKLPVATKITYTNTVSGQHEVAVFTEDGQTEIGSDTEACADLDNDGKCDKCKAKMPGAACEHTETESTFKKHEPKDGKFDEIVKCKACGEQVGEAVEHYYGDVNGDGQFIVGEFQVLIPIVRQGGTLPTEWQKFACDVNEDGKIDDDDIALISACGLNKDIVLPTETERAYTYWKLDNGTEKHYITISLPDYPDADLSAVYKLSEACTDENDDGKCDLCGHCEHRTTEVRNAVEATCGEDGYTGDTVCTVCGMTVTEGTVIPATGEHVDENGDGICDVCGEVLLIPVPTRKAGYPAETSDTVKTGMAYLLSDLQNGKIFDPVEGKSLNYRNYYYQRSTDGGETWDQMMDFSEAIFGMTTIQLTENEAGTYVYRFYASHDGVHFSTDTWTLTLTVEDEPTLDFSFYVGKDYTGSYPIIKLYDVTTDDEGNEVLGDEIENVFLYSNFTDTLPEGEEEYDPALGKLVSNYQMFYAKLTAGRYAYRAFAKNTDTDEYDVALGGMTLDFPTDTNVDGLTGGGTDIYLQCNSFYVSSRKLDNTYFTEDEYHVRVDCPIMKCSAAMGDAYIKGSYTYYPTVIYAAGNACLYNLYAYPDIEGYIFTQSINQTFRAGYSAGTKSLTINTGVDLKITVPEDAEFGLYFQWNNFNTTEVAPEGDEDVPYADRWTVKGDGTKSATYFISKGNGNYTWRLSDEEHVTKTGWLSSLSASAELALSFDNNAPTNRLSHDFSKLGTTTINRDEADIQVNLDPTGFKAITDKTRVRAYRHWELINSDAGNIMVEPDFEWYTIGELGGDALIETVNGGNAKENWADITPGAEDSFIAVQYYSADVDSLDSTTGALKAGTHGGLYPATNPERVGVIVVGGTDVAHGKADAKVKYNMASGVTTTRSADWDYNYDTWYYNDIDPELTFTVANASGDVDVRYAMVAFDASLNPEVKQWEGAPVDNDGVYHIAVNEIFGTIGNGKGGTVIIRMEDSTGVSYRLVRASKVTITATNVTNVGEPIMPGDQVKLSFSGMYRSVNKISGVFNPTTFKPTYYSGETKYEGTLGQYQKMDNATVTVTIPEDVEFEDGSDTAVYTFTNGYTFGSMYSAANPFAFLYNMTDAGVGTNFNAVTVNYYLHHYADAAVTVYRKALYSVKLNTLSTTGEALSGVAVTLTDAKGNTYEAGEDGLYSLGYSSYSYVLKKDGYVVTRGSFTLGSADAEKVVDGVLTIETAAMRACLENAWDGTTKTEPQKDAEGTYLIGNAAELAWFAENVDGKTTSVNGRLTADIELTGYDWKPINKYYGTLDGDGHVIYNLYINSSSYPVGLIGYLKTGASVTKLGVTGDVTSTNTSYGQAGGIAGYLEDNAPITKCFSAVNVTAGKHGGGIAGYTDSSSVITDCYATGTIRSISANACYFGGICGSYYNQFAGATLTNCYSTATVIGSGMTSSFIGGLSPVDNEKYFVNSYYLEGTLSGGRPVSGVSGKGTVKTADELKALAPTLGESFAEDSQNINGGYPVLAWQNSAPEYALGDVNGDGEINNLDAALIYAYHNGKIELTAEQLARADVNGDGAVNNLDAALVYAYHNGKITAFPKAQ